jgi:signal peptidase II
MNMDAEGTPGNAGMKDIVWTVGVALAVLCLILVDQWTKALALQYLVPGQTVSVISAPVVGDLCLLVLVWNTGAFLSLGAGMGGLVHVLFMIGIPLVALAGMAVYLSRPWWPRRAAAIPASLRLAIGFALAGGAGNLIDRIREGKVVDFLNFGIGPVRTGVMNVADLYILGAIICLLVYWIRHYRRSGQGA